VDEVFDDFDVELVADGRETAIRVVGEVDSESRSRLAAVLREVSDEVRVLRVDLGEVTFMDAAGLRTLLEVQRRLSAASCRLVLVRPSPALLRLFELTAVDRFFEYDDEAA